MIGGGGGRDTSGLASVSRRLAIAGLLGVPTSIAVSRVFFGSRDAGLSVLDYLAGYGYCLGAWFGILTFAWLCLRPEDSTPRIIGRQASRIYWTAALLISAAAATIIVVGSEKFLNNQHAYWLKLTVQTISPQPPPLIVRYGSGRADFAEFQWQPYQDTILTARRAGAVAQPDPVRIADLKADGKLVDLATVGVNGGTKDSGGILMAAKTGMLRWSGRAREISFQVSGTGEPLEVYWLDEVRRVQPGPAPVSVSFNLPGTYIGWALLPPQPIEVLSLANVSPTGDTYDVRAEVLGGTPSAAGLVTARILPFAATAILCRLPEPINRRRPAVLLGAWMGLFGAGLATFFLILRCSILLEIRRPLIALRSACCPDGPGPSEQLAVFFRVALPVWLVCINYHLLFALSIKTAVSNDSIGYYGMARAFLVEPYFQGIIITRTPGYPLFLAAVLHLFGDTVRGIALIQHFALASTSLITIWALWDRLPRRWVIIAGLLAGSAPAITPTANILWTEAWFSVLGSWALLLASCYRRRLAYLALAGVCAGLATMIRPNGLLLVAAVVGSLILEFLWSRAQYGWRAYVRAAVVFGSGYALIAAPWHMHLALNRDTFALGKGMRDLNAWFGYVFEDQLPVDLPINLPNRAIYADPTAYGNDGYTLMNAFPLIMGNQERYYRETEAEWLRSQNWAPYLACFKYNVTLHRDPKDLFFASQELREALSFWQRLRTLMPGGGGYVVDSPLQPGFARPPEPPIAPTACLGRDAVITNHCGSHIQDMLLHLTSAAPPASPTAGLGLVRLSGFVVDHWRWLMIAVLLGAFGGVVMPWMIPLFLYCLSTVLVFSTTLAPVERYIVVLEPIYYVLSIGGAYAVYRISFRLRSTMVSASAPENVQVKCVC